jgi:small subunit ribosomal protein S2
VDYVIPGNDDAIRSISLISRLVANVIIEGRGEEAAAADNRPVPPAVEEAQVSEEATETAAPEGAAAAADGRPGEAPVEVPTDEASQPEESTEVVGEAPAPEETEQPEAEEQEESEAREAEGQLREAQAVQDAEAAEPEATAEPEAGEPETGENASSDEDNKETEE